MQRCAVTATALVISSTMQRRAVASTALVRSKYTNTIYDLLFVVFLLYYIQAFLLITSHVDLSSWDIVKIFTFFAFIYIFIFKKN